MFVPVRTTIAKTVTAYAMSPSHHVTIIMKKHCHVAHHRFSPPLFRRTRASAVVFTSKILRHADCLPPPLLPFSQGEREFATSATIFYAALRHRVSASYFHVRRVTPISVPHHESEHCLFFHHTITSRQPFWRAQAERSLERIFPPRNPVNHTGTVSYRTAYTEIERFCHAISVRQSRTAFQARAVNSPAPQRVSRAFAHAFDHVAGFFDVRAC